MSLDSLRNGRCYSQIQTKIPGIGNCIVASAMFDPFKAAFVAGILRKHANVIHVTEGMNGYVHVYYYPLETTLDLHSNHENQPVVEDDVASSLDNMLDGIKF